MRNTPRASVVTLIAVLAAMAACVDISSTEPNANPDKPAATPHLDAPLAVLSCSGSVAESKVTCGAASIASSGRKDAVLLGGQGVFVQLTSSNASYSAIDSTFKFDVTMQNLIPQPLSTTDGAAADAAGVKVFFVSGPTVTSGTGVASVIADGVGAFTAGGQPFYQYTGAALGGDGILSQNETSSAKQWTLKVPPAATFSFLLYVWAEVPFPNGYVDVTPAKDTLETGETLGLTATIRNYLGQSVAGSVIWSTSNGSAAQVDAGGTVTAAGAGSANIIATSGLRTGSAKINVCPALALGQTFTATMPLAAELCFKGYGGGAEYTYVPVNQSTASNLSLTVTGTGIQAVTGPPSPNMVPSGNLLAPSLSSSAATLGFEGTIASDVPYLGNDSPKIQALMRDISSRIKKAERGDSRIRYSIASGPAVGDSLSFNTSTDCTLNSSVRRGVVRSVTNHTIIVADTANPAGGYTTAQYDSIALEFDSIAWAPDSANFGAPTDIDENGHVIAFFTRAVNELSPPASSAVVTGFFSSKDLFSNASCHNSNQGEMFYMLVPDPTGAVNSNVRTVSFVRGTTVGTMGHEFQHLINAWRRGYVTFSAFFEEGWLNEGLSHIAEELMFYRTSVGLAPKGNIVVSQLTTGPNASRRVAAFNTYANANYGRLRSWLQRPDTAGAFEVGHQNSLAVRGAIWSFLRYASDRKGPDDQSFFFGLVNNNLEGLANLQNSLGADPHDWLRDWAASMYNDDAVSGNAAPYTNPSWDYRSLYTALNGSYQLAPRPISNGVGLTLSYSRDGGASYVRFGVPGGAFASVTALSGGTPPLSPYTLTVTRTK